MTFGLVQIPKKGKIYSVNEGNAKNWDGPTAKYVGLALVFLFVFVFIFHTLSIKSYNYLTVRFVESCKFPKDGSSPKSLRYIGRYLNSSTICVCKYMVFEYGSISAILFAFEKY